MGKAIPIFGLLRVGRAWAGIIESVCRFGACFAFAFSGCSTTQSLTAATEDSQTSVAAQPVVALTVEVEMDTWDNLFFFDQSGHGGPGDQFWHSLFHTNEIRRCIVGTNRWMIDDRKDGGRRTYWFDGTNLVDEHASAAQGGVWLTEISSSTDGNPGRPVRVTDRMTFDWSAKAYWLALCSGPCLKHAGRTIYLPNDIWKENLAVPGWKDEVETFPDAFGLPKTVTLRATNGQVIFQYRAHATTNAFGATFPLEFYGVQYGKGGAEGWCVELTYKGRITAIEPASSEDLAVPTEVLKRAKRWED